MPFPLQRFRWLFVLGCAVVGWLVADLLVGKGPLHAFWQQSRAGGCVVEMNGTPITRLELEEALREHLWRHNESWAALDVEARKQIRQLVLNNLVDGRLIRAARLEGDGKEAASADARRESEMMRRQFANAEEYPSRLDAQRHTQQSLDASIREAQLDEQWIARKIASRVAEVTEGEVRAWYDKSKETLRIPQAHHAAHLFLTRHDKAKPDREAEIRAIHRQLVAKEQTFAALAARHSDDDRSKAIGGDLGWFTRERMPADFIAAVEKLKVGQFSEPVLTQLGWHIIIVLERRESRLPTFEEARAEISSLLTRQRRDAALKSLMAGLRQRAQQTTKYHAEIIDRVEPAP
jgi:parvulin-like peptidyl-prolyl isomerase